MNRARRVGNEKIGIASTPVSTAPSNADESGTIDGDESGTTGESGSVTEATDPIVGTQKLVGQQLQLQQSHSGKTTEVTDQIVGQQQQQQPDAAPSHSALVSPPPQQQRAGPTPFAVYPDDMVEEAFCSDPKCRCGVTRTTINDAALNDPTSSFSMYSVMPLRAPTEVWNFFNFLIASQLILISDDVLTKI